MGVRGGVLVPVPEEEEEEWERTGSGALYTAAGEDLLKSLRPMFLSVPDFFLVVCASSRGSSYRALPLALALALLAIMLTLEGVEGEPVLSKEVTLGFCSLEEGVWPPRKAGRGGERVAWSSWDGSCGGGGVCAAAAARRA